MHAWGFSFLNSTFFWLLLSFSHNLGASCTRVPSTNIGVLWRSDWLNIATSILPTQKKPISNSSSCNREKKVVIAVASIDKLWSYSFFGNCPNAVLILLLRPNEKKRGVSSERSKCWDVSFGATATRERKAATWIWVNISLFSDLLVQPRSSSPALMYVCVLSWRMLLDR